MREPKQGDLGFDIPVRVNADDPWYNNDYKVDVTGENFIPNGEICPTCGQLAKEYKRKLYSSMALALIYLCKIHRQTNDWVHVNQVTKKTLRHNVSLGGDMAKLEYWGLICQKKNEDTKKRTSGLWQPTADGVAFALYGGKVMSHVKLYNGGLNGFDGEMIDITEALGERFDYQELMQS